MVYENIREGVFLCRPNRFIAEVEIGGNAEICHVKNTGRCKELIVQGTRVYVNQVDNPTRSTKYDLVSVWKGDRLINMDSQAPNRTFGEYLRQGKFIENTTLIKPETKYGDSRIDFYVETEERKVFIEVKGVTLEENGIAMFPDAPTERGVKHLNELAKCVADGYEAFVVFVIQMKDVTYFTPNYKTHPEFGAALVSVIESGVKAVAFDCVITEDSMDINGLVPIKL
ncbi:sugar fermentation stimulation protein SfsA [Clostridia bacterium]|nr:sugar fermentation stimulation protein SfsA [Clostridia bacterium]